MLQVPDSKACALSPKIREPSPQARLPWLCPPPFWPEPQGPHREPCALSCELPDLDLE